VCLERNCHAGAAIGYSTFRLLSVTQVHEELEEHSVPDSVHDLPEEGPGHEVEVHMVLPECLWVLYAGAIFDTREGFKDLSGTDWEIRERAGSWAIEGTALGWRYRGLMRTILHIEEGRGT
jgi:hypothetical protein